MAIAGLWQPGVTAGFGGVPRLLAMSRGRSDMRGTGGQPIRFSSTLACGDKTSNPTSLVVPGDTGLYAGIYVTLGGIAGFEYCTVEHAFDGLWLEGWTAPVKGCRFSGCWQGVEHGAFNGTRTIENCLFRDIRTEGVLVWRSGPATILNSTFYRCEGTAVYFGVGSSGNSVRNSIFVQNQLGIHKEPETGLTENHNCFYDNGPDGQNHANFPLQGQPPNVYADPKFVNTQAAELYARFCLDQSLSPCINAGNPNDPRFMSTALDGRLDVGIVDIGRHRPIRGLLKVGPNFFFEFENGESFYPIAVTNMPNPLEDTTEPSAFYGTTVPLYLKCLADHGVNMLRAYTFVNQTTPLQNQEGAVFLDKAVGEYSKFFDAVEAKGLCYMLVAWSTMGHDDSYSPPPSDCIYFHQNGGTVPDEAMGWFFKPDGSNGSYEPPNRAARQHFKESLDQFLDRGTPSSWYRRSGLIGWDLFSQISNDEMWLEWQDGYDADNPVSDAGRNREATVGGWVSTMLDYMEDGEQSRLGRGDHRLHWVDVANLRRFKQYDPDSSQNQPDYLDLQVNQDPINDYIDYHLYTMYYEPADGREHWDTEAPQNPFTPLRHYLGVEGTLGTYQCSLPEVIYHYRTSPTTRRGGFFSSEMGPCYGWAYEFAIPLRVDVPRPVPKRLMNDCYHNYLWLGFATGSVGGPTPLWCPEQWLGMNHWNLSGVNYFNAVKNSGQPRGYPLNSYTEEILDSLQSLSRFTSLVRWRYADASYRPMRMARNEQPPGPRVVLRRGPNTWDPEIPETAYLWTGASDGCITIGWIVRNFLHDYTKPERDDPLTPDTQPVYAHISGLASGTPLELVWFDDHRGKIIGSPVSGNGSFVVEAPPTETGPPAGFGKSIAFLIQPVGFTPSTSFDELPNHVIGQIVVDPPSQRSVWRDEWPQIKTGSLTFTAWTKPLIGTGYYFEWVLTPINIRPLYDYRKTRLRSGPALNSITEDFAATDWGEWDVLLIIKQQGKRVSGDLMIVDMVN